MGRDRFRLLFEAMQDGVLVADLDTGKLVLGNPAICRMLGCDPAEIPTLGFADIHPPESLATVRGLIDRQLSGEQPMAEDVPVRRRDGTVLYADIHAVPFSFHESPCILGIFHEVTARREAERELIVTRDRLEAMLDALEKSEKFLRDSQRVSGVGSYILDVKTGTWTASETLMALFGMGNQTQGTIETWASLVHPDDREETLAYFQSVVAERKAFDREYRIIRASDGAERWVHGLGVLKLDESGEPVLMTGTIQDVTTRHLAELEREHLLAAEQAARIEAEMAVKARDEFLSVAAHELKTPLAALRIVAEAMAKKREAMGEIPEFVRKSMETVDRQSQRLVRLVNALLDITRLQTGRYELNIRSVDLVTALGGVLRRLEPSLDQAGCTVQVELPELLLVECDRDRMEQVFENILSNAMKFAAGKPITIRGYPDGQMVRIEVRDHGPGIPGENHQRIFDLYDRGDLGLHAGGLGIGLFVSRRILEAHHGTIAVRNADDGGAVFTLAIPAG